MVDSKPTATDTPTKGAKINDDSKARSQRIINKPQDVAQVVMMQIDNVNSKKDELTIAVKGLADTAKQLVRAYAQQQAQIAKLAERLGEVEKKTNKT
ncbi:MAG: hypothetical protein AB1810_06980 [Pseudomonadota bacterium]